MSRASAIVRFVLAIGLAVVAAMADAAPPHHDLHVRLDPETRTLVVHAVIAFDGGEGSAIRLGAAYRVAHASLDGRSVSPLRDAQRLQFDVPAAAGTPHRFEIEYEGMLEALRDIDHKGTLGALPPMAGTRGSYLPAGSGWYPQLGDSFFTYRLTLELPAGQRGIVPGRLVEESDAQAGYRARYEFLHPVEGIELMAGPYAIGQRVMRIGERTIQLRTWFHPEIADLSRGYLDSVEAYIRRYDAQIGPYAFDRFDVVSGPLPTGFGMPGLTYLGVDVLRLPFIRTTSLGHEVLHNWWGNGVYADYAAGNWAEGLTTFMADYAYKEQEGPDAARAMRLEWLRDFAAVPPGQDTPLRAFTARTHGTSQIVGYDKAAFVFLMLRDAIGEQAFLAALRSFWHAHEFETAGWPDLQYAFEAAAGQDLSGFFAQWLDRTGAPRLSIVAADGQGDTVQVTLQQSQPAYALRVPLAFDTADGALPRVISIDSARATLAVSLPSPARSVALDPQLRLFRMLKTEEVPPILRNVMINARTQLAIASKDPAFVQAAHALAGRVLDEAPKSDATNDASAPLLVIGRDEAIADELAQGRLPPAPPDAAGKGDARVWVSRLPSGRIVAVVAARDSAALRSLERGLPHYGRQSWLVFEDGRAIARGVAAPIPQEQPVHRK